MSSEVNNDLKLLYVEDDLDVVSSLIEVLEEIFDEVIIAKNGAEALALYEIYDIDMIITDINMPNMNGIELIKHIRKENESIPIIMTTAQNESSFLIESIKLKVDGYILKPLNIFELIEDIDKQIEKLQVKKELEQSKKSLEEYKQAIDDSAIVSKTDPQGIITYVNKAFCEITGYTEEELLGKSHNIVRHPDTPSSVFKVLWTTIQNKKPWNGIIKNKKKDGTPYYVKTSISPIIDNKGEVVEYIGIRQDITELELYREDIEKQLDEATKEIIDTQKEVVYTMGAIGETRSKETGLHVKRVAEYSYLLAVLYGLDQKEAALLKQASPMHDIGKVGIPDAILNKPGKLTPEEFETMKDHAVLGYEMLQHSNKSILKAAAIVAQQHHEKWDGNGYPNRLKGEEIHIYGRITAIADVFDALGHDRVYKKAWELEKIFELFKNERGKHFDPQLIDIFFSNIDKFLKIKDELDD